MRTPGEPEGEAGAGAPRARGAVGAHASAAAETPRARSFRAARARVPLGGKAAARLLTFLERRGLTPVSKKGPAVASAPHLARVSSARSGRSKATDYQRALAGRPGRRTTTGAAGGQVPWRFLGPSSIPRGQTYGSGAGASPAVAGRVAAVAVDPKAPGHLLVGSAGGGIWETKNAGRNWVPRTDDQPSLGIGALVFDPSDPNKAYAGTGEGNSLEVPGQGLLRSTDGGTSWTLVAAKTFAGSFFYRMVVDPTDGRRLFAATSLGTFRSTNSGTSWTRLRSALTWDISLGTNFPMQPNAPAELLAACEDGLYRSVDRGTSWTRVRPPSSPQSFVNVVGRMAVAHAPADAGVAYVFAARQDSVWLWRRHSPGGAFAEVPLPSLDPPGPGEPGNGISQSWYDWCLGVSPSNPDVVFIGAIDAFRGRRSTTGNWTWTDISSRASGDSIHPDQHTVVFDPSDPQVVYFGNDGGLFRSPNDGDSWESLNNGLAITEFEYLAQHPQSRTWIIGGTQDNGTLRNRRAGVWDQIALGDGGDCAVEQSSPLTCYHSYYGMAMERSRSGGDTWKDVTPPVPKNYYALFYPPLEANGKTVARAGESAWISDDEGDSWAEVGLPSGDRASAMTFTADGRLLVGREDGRIFRLRKAGGGWGGVKELATPRRGGYVSDLLAQPANGERFWATFSTLNGGHVYLSDDGGSAWQDVTANLPDVPVSAVETDPKNPDRIWVATDRGVFQSTNRGSSWSLFGSGLPRALAVDLAFHARLRLLRVGTRSRGVWEVKVP